VDELEPNEADGGAPSMRGALIRLAGVVGDLVEREPELRAALSGLVAAWRAPVLSEPEPAPDCDGGPGESEEPGTQETETAPLDLVTREQLEDLVGAMTGRLPEGVVPSGPEIPAKPPVSARLIVERCRLKQRACLVAAELDENLLAGQVGVPHDRFQALINEARALPDCFLWMLRPQNRGWTELEDWKLLARAFDNLARAVALADSLVESIDRDEEQIKDALSLAAEAQRALRQAVTCCMPADRNFEDPDQLGAYRWLSRQCETLRIFVTRHMKVDDPADPREWAGLAARIAAVEERRSALSDRTRQVNKILGKIRYEAQRLADAPPVEVEQRVVKIARAADELVAAGIAPSERRLRDLLLPVFEILEESADSPSEGFRLVMREMDRYLASRGRGREVGSPQDMKPGDSPEVARVRKWLGGREIVLVGGEERGAVVQRLKEDFGLKDLVWITTRPHESNDLFRAPIQRPEVAVVLLAIRWSSHSYGGIREFCEAAGKPLVRLPGGYGTNRVAREIVEQASEALG
jgi:hypothetical protein